MHAFVIFHTCITKMHMTLLWVFSSYWDWVLIASHSTLYTCQCDIHAIGIVLLQMLMGLDVMERFPDTQTAVHACQLFFAFLFCFCSLINTFSFLVLISPLSTRQAMNMLQPYCKNQVNFLSLLSELTEGTAWTPSISRVSPTTTYGMYFDIPVNYFLTHWLCLNS